LIVASQAGSDEKTPRTKLVYITDTVEFMSKGSIQNTRTTYLSKVKVNGDVMILKSLCDTRTLPPIV
jgi:hypothetical protein